MTKRQILGMTKLNISEAATVQFPMVRHAAEIGWTPLPPQAAARKRGGEAGLLFRAEIEEALGRFNPWMTADAIRTTVEKLEALPPTIEGNREMLAWLRGGRQGYDETEQLHRPVRLIDFETPGANVFHVSWEWKLKPPARKGNRADVMFVVNGVPVVIVEHKNPKDADAIERGITQLRRYEKETPELMGAAQLFNVTHLLDYWYGVTWNASRRFRARWKERQEERRLRAALYRPLLRLNSDERGRVVEHIFTILLGAGADDDARARLEEVRYGKTARRLRFKHRS